LDLTFEPVGLTGETTGTLQVLDWNEQAYFASTPEPSCLGLVAIGALGLLRRRRPVR
jgi:MYXO-CTERM domain-containing protein